MSLKNGQIISETMTYIVKSRIFTRTSWLPFFRKKIVYLVGYRKKDNRLILDDYVSMHATPSWVDPFNWFIQSGHVLLTRHALKRFGFSKKDTKECIHYNLNVDRYKRGRDHFHFMPHTRAMSEQVIKNCLQRAVNLTDKAYYWLGTGLHVLQDRYAHYEQHAGLKEHLPFGIDPDNPEKHPYEYWRAYLASQEYIRLFLAKRTERLQFARSITIPLFFTAKDIAVRTTSMTAN